MKRIAVVLSFFIAASALPQQARHRTAAVKGQAVTVTKSGEVKPALFAKVYLLNCTDKTEPSGENICLVYARLLVEVTHNDRMRLEQEGAGREKPLEVLQVSEGRSALAYTTAARVNRRDLDSVLFNTKTDATGKFEFANVDQGKKYMILAFGQAGSFDCNWQSKPFVIPANGMVNLTLNEPDNCALND